jgi:hypothetical protein
MRARDTAQHGYYQSSLEFAFASNVPVCEPCNWFLRAQLRHLHLAGIVRGELGRWFALLKHCRG